MNVRSRHTVIALMALVALAALVAGNVAVHATRAAVAPATIPDDVLVDALHANGNTVARITGSLLVVRDASPADGVVVLPPGRALAPGELDAVARHAGRVLVLDHAPAAQAVGVAIGSLPVRAAEGDGAITAAAHWDGRAVTRLALPDARPLVDTREGARALVTTANGTFLDADSDGRMSTGDAVGPFVVASTDRDGRVVVVASRGLATAEGAAVPGNDAFLRDLLARTFPAGTRVLVDATSAAGSPLAALTGGAAAVPALVAHAPLVGLPAAALALLAAGAVAAGARDGARTRREDSP